MNESKIAEERIKKLLLSDKIGAYSGFIEMLKTDIYNTLKEYMEIKKIELNIEPSNNDFVLSIQVNAINIISPNSVK